MIGRISNEPVTLRDPLGSQKSFCISTIKRHVLPPELFAFLSLY